MNTVLAALQRHGSMTPMNIGMELNIKTECCDNFGCDNVPEILLRQAMQQQDAYRNGKHVLIRLRTGGLRWESMVFKDLSWIHDNNDNDDDDIHKYMHKHLDPTVCRCLMDLRFMDPMDAASVLAYMIRINNAPILLELADWQECRNPSSSSCCNGPAYCDACELIKAMERYGHVETRKMESPGATTTNLGRPKATFLLTRHQPTER